MVEPAMMARYKKNEIKEKFYKNYEILVYVELIPYSNCYTKKQYSLISMG